VLDEKVRDDEVVLPTPPSSRRQWGAERRADPMPIIHPKPSQAALTWGRVAIVVTVLLWVGYVVDTILRQFLDHGGRFAFVMQSVTYLLVVTLLALSSLIYLVTRQGALRRFKAHHRVPRGLLDAHFTEQQGALTVLIPSYAEEPEIVRMTLWSAALQEYPDLRIVLLIDDAPAPADPVVAQRLDATRALAGEIEAALTVPHARASLAYEEARREYGGDRRALVSGEPLRMLADEYLAAATWIETMGLEETVHDHVSEFFVEQVLRGLASELRLTHLGLQGALDQDGSVTGDRLLELYRRLVWIFSARLGNFERKRYASLPQEANKAMNVNAYLGLMGAVWRPEASAEGTILVRLPAGAEAESGDIAVERTEYTLTLDADSQLLRDYCLRLVYHLEQPENADIAVIQTPYSSYRGAPTRLERMAGATTDIQHILHQGMTAYNATFWVGANAIIRRDALDDIEVVETVGGHEIHTYIQDRTVIEDTESSIDITAAGWRLVNYPERLSYSATPPDFGSLVVQRRRWANGGLLILPKFVRHVRRRRREGDPLRLGEVMLRFNYMSSLAWSSIGLIFLLVFPYDRRLLSPLVVLMALPYFAAMAVDLRSCGHRYLDVVRIYGFNLVLLAVNLAGVIKSVQQAFTGEKIPFARTPKVRDRTASPAIYVAVPYFIVIFSLVGVWHGWEHRTWGNVAFAAVNAFLTATAVRSCIGVRNSVVDLVMGVVNWLYVPVKKPAVAAAAVVDGPMDWEGILFHGDRRLDRDLRQTDERRRRLTPGRR